jgi:RHS repeat-associated protein
MSPEAEHAMNVSRPQWLRYSLFVVVLHGVLTCDASATRAEPRGTWLAECDYHPYGRLIRETAPKTATCPFCYSTKYRDPDLELYYYGYRWYDAAAMKWLTPDPIGERGGANLTAFCEGDPINQVDPLGLEPWTRRGHHIVPISEVEEIQRVTGPWSEDLLRALDSKRIPTLVTHGWDVAHRQYNLRVRSILETYLSKRKLIRRNFLVRRPTSGWLD